jgi:hypothetical protein
MLTSQKKKVIVFLRLFSVLNNDLRKLFSLFSLFEITHIFDVMCDLIIKYFLFFRMKVIKYHSFKDEKLAK